MEGYFKPGLKGEKGILKIEATNIPQFNELLKEVKEEADRLQNTIRQLSNFELTIELSTDANEEIKQTIQNGAFSAKTNALSTENY